MVPNYVLFSFYFSFFFFKYISLYVRLLSLCLNDEYGAIRMWISMTTFLRTVFFFALFVFLFHRPTNQPTKMTKKKKTLRNSSIIYVILFNFMHFYWIFASSVHSYFLFGRLLALTCSLARAYSKRLPILEWPYRVLFGVHKLFLISVHPYSWSCRSFIHWIRFIYILIALYPLFYVCIVIAVLSSAHIYTYTRVM